MRKRTHRKVYPLQNPLVLAMTGAAITDTAILDRVRMTELQALEAFRTGQAAKPDWDALADLLNVSETFSRMGVGPEAVEACQRAQEALGQAHRRYIEHGRIATSGPELQALREAYDWHDVQRASVSRGEYERAIEKTRNRILGAHPSVKVMLPAKPTTGEKECHQSSSP